MSKWIFTKQIVQDSCVGVTDDIKQECRNHLTNGDCRADQNCSVVNTSYKCEHLLHNQAPVIGIDPTGDGKVNVYTLDDDDGTYNLISNIYGIYIHSNNRVYCPYGFSESIYGSTTQKIV